jgi:outer membrane receptor for ferrienterochelin and colicins
VKNLLGLILVFSFANAFGNKVSIYGRVISDKGFVSDASITLMPSNKHIWSDERGEFSFSNLQPGKYQIQIAAFGYQNKVLVLKNLTKDTLLSIHLVPLTGELQELTVNGNAGGRIKSSSPAPIEIFGKKFLQKNASNNLFESLQLINGVQPTINCNVCNTGEIRINGLDGPYTLILIDGMPIVSSLSSVYGLNGIPTSLIERIEVTKGVGESIYSSESAAGTINVITKLPRNSSKFNLDYKTSSYYENNLDLGFAKSHKKIDFLLSSNLFYFNNRVDLNSDNFTDITLQKRVSLFSKIQWNRSAELSSQLAARVFYEDRFGGEMQWTPEFRGGDSIYGESIYTKRLEVLAKHPFFIGSQKLDYQISFNSHNQNSAYGNNNFLAQQTTFFNQLLYERKINIRHRTKFGATFRYVFYDDNSGATANSSSLQNTLVPGVFAQDEWTVNEKNSFLLGSRLDFYSAHGWVFSPRIHYKLLFGSNQTLRLSLGNGFRVVNIFTEDHAALTGAREVILKGQIKPEKSWNGNLQYSKFKNIKKGFLEWDLNAFYSYFTNKIIPDYTTNSNQIIYANTNGFAVSRGLSANLEASFSFPLKVDIGFTWMQVYSKSPDSLGVYIKQNQIHAPGFSSNFLISYQIKKWDLTVDYTGQIFGPMRMPILPNDFRPEYSPWYSLQNIQFIKKWNSTFEVYFGVKNLGNFLPENPILRWWDPFDKQASDPTQNPNGYTFDPNYNYAPMQARRVFVGLRYSLK